MPRLHVSSLLASSALAALLPLAALPGAALADGAALVLGVEDYATLGDVRGGDEVASAVDGLAALGFDVTAVANGTGEDAAKALAAWMDRVPAADRLVVALSGHFVTDGRRTWYQHADAPESRLFTVDRRPTLSLDSLLLVMAQAPSRAVLVLGLDADADGAFDPWLREGVGELAIPEGVTVLMGGPNNVANFLADELSVPGGDLARLVAENGRIRAEGYLPRGFVLMPASDAVVAEPDPGPRLARALAEEAALWQGAVALDTVEAYGDYLRAYPRGRFAAQAQQGIAAIRAEPNREARLAEEALELDRDARRAIQRDLALLDFDPRGIDGVFGPGTRSAVTNWQQENGFAQTSYLDAEQIARIDAQARRRAAQLEAEAQRQAEAAARADRAYWEETGAQGDEAGLRAYLERYPDGAYAEAAADSLTLIEQGKRQAARAEDRAAWDAARRTDSLRSYQGYLEAYPEGGFVEEARARRNALVEESGAGEVRAAARAAEDALGLNALTAQVIEQRLEGLGLDPGAVDGTFDRETRRAIRNYQRDRGLPVTGFVSEPTLVRLLADALGAARN